MTPRKRRLESVASETESELAEWGAWVRRDNQSGLGIPRVAPMFRWFMPRYPAEADLPLDVVVAERVDAIVRTLVREERQVLALVFVEGAPTWEAVAKGIRDDPIERSITRHQAREIAERAAARIEAWMRAEDAARNVDMPRTRLGLRDRA